MATYFHGNILNHVVILVLCRDNASFHHRPTHKCQPLPRVSMTFLSSTAQVAIGMEKCLAFVDCILQIFEAFLPPTLVICAATTSLSWKVVGTCLVVRWQCAASEKHFSGNGRRSLDWMGCLLGISWYQHVSCCLAITTANFSYSQSF